MELLPFAEQSLRHFIYLERPEGLDMADQDALAAVEKAEPLPIARDDEIGPRLQDFATIGELYRAIELGLDRLAERLGEARLFLGPPAAQAIVGHFPFASLVAVTDLASAHAAIDTIVEQGEGARGDWREAHFGRLVTVLDEYLDLRDADPAFEPSRPVLAAVVRPREDGLPVPLISDPFTSRSVDLLNAVYEVILQLLARYFAHTDETDDQLDVLAKVSIGLMQSVVKPLGGLVTRLPVGPEHPGAHGRPDLRAVLRDRLPAPPPRRRVGRPRGADAGPRRARRRSARRCARRCSCRPSSGSPARSRSSPTSSPRPARPQRDVAAASAGSAASAGCGLLPGADRATITPTMHVAPPTIASAGGISPRSSQEMTIATGGTRYVVAPSRPAAVRLRAIRPRQEPEGRREQPEVDEPADVGRPRGRTSRSRVGVKTRQISQPVRQAIQVTCSGDTFRSAGFWKVTPIPYSSAARTHRPIPRSELPPPPAAPDVATPMITAPPKAMAMPGQQSWRQRLAEEHEREERDEDRAEVGEHRRGPGVDMPFRLVERDVVDREPRDAGRDDQQQVASRDRPPAGPPDHEPEREHADAQAPERDRPGREDADEVADPDERRRPDDDGHERGAERPPIDDLAVRSAHRDSEHGPGASVARRLGQDLDDVAVQDAMLAPDALPLEPRRRPPDPGAGEDSPSSWCTESATSATVAPILQRERLEVGRAVRAQAHAQQAREPPDRVAERLEARLVQDRHRHDLELGIGHPKPARSRPGRPRPRASPRGTPASRSPPARPRGRPGAAPRDRRPRACSTRSRRRSAARRAARGRRRGPRWRPR